MSLELTNIWKSYPHRGGVQHVLRGVDLRVERGQFVSLIGHSGCGKSTLLNVAGGLTSPDGGTALLDGKPITGPGPDRAMVSRTTRCFLACPSFKTSTLPLRPLVPNTRQLSATR